MTNTSITFILSATEFGFEMKSTRANSVNEKEFQNTFE